MKSNQNIVFVTSVIIVNLMIAEAMPRTELSIKKDSNNSNNNINNNNNNHNHNNGNILSTGCKLINPSLASKSPLKKEQLTRWGNAGAYSMFYVNQQANIHHQIKKLKENDKMRAKYCSMPSITSKPLVTRPTKPPLLGPIAVPFFSSYGWGPMG